MATARRNKDRAAFTLVELLVVIGIITILAGLLTPAIMGAMRKAHEASTVNTIHQVELAAQAFMNDFGEYPPSTWAQFDELFEYDSSSPGLPGVPDGAYNRADDEVFFEFRENTAGFVGGPNLDPTSGDGFGDQLGITAYNEGIEVLTACLATRNGGPYLEPDASLLSNTDGDREFNNLGDANDGNHVARASNWYFSPNSGGDFLLEITDYWGNPLTYFRNDEYDERDGFYPGTDSYENPTVYFPLGILPPPPPAGTGVEWARYVSAEGDIVVCYARSYLHHYDQTQVMWQENTTGNYPNLNEFQIYSWGSDEQPGCSQALDPTTGAALLDAAGNAYGNPNEVLDGNAQWPGWNADSENLTNWGE